MAECRWRAYPTKGALLKRDITRVLTPGTVLEEGMLSARRNNWLAAVVVERAQQERQRSGISTLKLQQHRTFGCFLAVSKARATTAPDQWIRSQTLANEERFITPDLKELEGRIFQLRTRACQREVEQRLVETAFIANDVQLGDGTDLVLTGPNATGKSCQLRQIGLIQ